MSEGKKRWKQNDWVCKRQKENGEIQSENKEVFPLPEIGSYVYVREKHTYFKRKKNADGNLVKCKYELADRFVDAWDVPIVYKVVGITGSLDDPVHHGGKILLEGRRNGGHYTYKEALDARLCVIGVYYLEERPNDIQVYKKRISDVDHNPIAEYTDRCLKKLMEKEQNDKN